MHWKPIIPLISAAVLFGNAAPLPAQSQSVPFDFQGGPQGWTPVAPDGIFTAPFSSHEAGTLKLEAQNNSDTFGYWDSPVFTPPTVDFVQGPSNPRDLFRISSTILSDVDQPIDHPQFRLRATTADLSYSVVSTVTSIDGFGGGMNVPIDNHPTGAQWKGFYEQLFPQPFPMQDIQLSFDILNIDPTDSATGAVHAEEINQSTIADSGITPPSQTTPSDIFVYDFSVGNDGGFERRSPPGVEKPVLFIDDDDGLNASGSIGPPESNFIFGSWTKETDIQLSRPTQRTVYLLVWDVKSKINIDDRERVPTFRLRVNDSTLARSWYINIDSTGQTPRVPTVGNPQTYYQWIEPPATTTNSTMTISFDYLWVDQGNDPNGAVALKKLTIFRYE